MEDEPNMDVAHWGHPELLTPKPEESFRVFIGVMGMLHRRAAHRPGRRRVCHARCAAVHGAQDRSGLIHKHYGT